MSYSMDDGAHGRTFMRTNDANDDPSNSRRPSLQTITLVALIFSWLLFDGTTRKCIIRRWCSLTTIVVEVLRLESRLFSLSLPPFLAFYLVFLVYHPVPSPASVPRCSPFGTPCSFASLSNLLPAATEENAIRIATPELITNRGERLFERRGALQRLGRR